MRLIACVFLMLQGTVGLQDISKHCIRDATQILTAAQEGQLWALHMLDASTKIPDGLLYGNIDQLGNYEECVQARTDKFQGLYCRVVMHISTSQDIRSISHIPDRRHNLRLESREGPELMLRAAVCVPSSCSPLDVQYLVQEYAPALLASLTGGIPPNVSAFVDPTYCSGSEEPISLVAWMLVGVLLLLLAVIVAATVVDSWGSPGNTRLPSSSALLSTLSVRQSVAQLFSLRAEPGSLGCLHGLRVLSMAWIILGHRYETFLFSPISNTNAIVDNMFRKPSGMPIMNAFLAVDTFFFLSGFLICFVFFREISRTKKFDVFQFYIYRFLRLTVPMAVVIAFYIALISHIADGPGWEGFIGYRFRYFCQKNWWAALTYVNNYVGIYEQCLEQTWYTSVDMQLAWLSPLVLVPLYHSPRAGQQIMTLLIVISCFIPFTITYLNNYPWTFDAVNNFFDPDAYVRDIYLPTHARATPYLIGMLLAYYIHNLHETKLRLSQPVLYAGWLLCTATCLAVVYTLAIPYQLGFEYEPVAASFYAGFHRVGWSLGLAWIVIACAKGYGGPVNAILSWTGFQPLSKLTYAAYLTHLIVLGGHTGSSRSTAFLSHYEAVRSFLGDLPMIFCISLLLYLTVEAPLMIALRRAFNRGNAANNKSKSDK